MNDIITLGEHIKIIRKQQKLTQKELGQLCGMSDSQVRNYELGFRTPSHKTLIKIASALKVPIETFMFANGYIETNQQNGIGNRIRELRWEKELSKEELAEICGIDPLDISVFEVRPTKIDKQVFSKIANALGVSETFLIWGSEEPTEEISTFDKINTFFNDLRITAASPTSTLTPNEVETLWVIIREYLSLNNTGRQKVYERIEELKELAKYTEKEE